MSATHYAVARARRTASRRRSCGGGSKPTPNGVKFLVGGLLVVGIAVLIAVAIIDITCGPFLIGA